MPTRRIVPASVSAMPSLIEDDGPPRIGLEISGRDDESTPGNSPDAPPGLELVATLEVSRSDLESMLAMLGPPAEPSDFDPMQ